jgi:hypothetical protein
MSSNHGFQYSFSNPSPLQGQAGRNGLWVDGNPCTGVMQPGQSGPLIRPHDQNGWDRGGSYKCGVGGGRGLERLLRAPPGRKHHRNYFGARTGLKGKRGDKNPARQQQDGSVQPRRPPAGAISALVPHFRKTIGAKLITGKLALITLEILQIRQWVVLSS